MRDLGGLTSTNQLTITIQGANDTPTINAITTPSIAENSSNGAVVTTAIATEVDSGDTTTFSLTNDAGGRFAINSSTGVITVANSSLLDFESATSHFNTGVSGEVDVGKSRENPSIHLNPKLACEVVLNQAASVFIYGLTTERNIELIQEAQY
jgi:hypothetical protein